MEFHELLTGAGYGFCGEENDPTAQVPCFVFETETVNDVAAYLRAMFVEVGLRQRKDGGLAFCLDVPDHEVRPWAIPINPPDVPKLEAQSRIARGCLTFVRAADGTVIDLTDFSLNLEQDWSGRVARALTHLTKGAVEDAQALLREVTAAHPESVPAAHHLLGRCHRAKGEMQDAVRCYRDAVRAARDVGHDRLIPYAAGPLSDMGVTYKKMGELGRAVHCFMHSLELRPNHPEALLSFFSLFPTEEKLVLFGAARVFAIGGRDALAETYLGNYCEASGRPLDLTIAAARDLARSVDLTTWPFHSEDFVRFSAFERGLEREAAPPESPATPAVKKKNGHNGHNGHGADHWLEALALRNKVKS